MNSKGVTLVELLITIIVMGILASVGLVSVQAVVENTEQAKVYSDALAVSEAVTLYCAEHIDECTPAAGRTYRGLKYEVIEEYLPNLDTDYYDTSRNIARISSDGFQNPQVRLRAQDDNDLSWYRWRDPKDPAYDKETVFAKNN